MLQPGSAVARSFSVRSASGLNFAAEALWRREWEPAVCVECGDSRTRKPDVNAATRRLHICRRGGGQNSCGVYLDGHVTTRYARSGWHRSRSATASQSKAIYQSNLLVHSLASLLQKSTHPPDLDTIKTTVRDGHPGQIPKRSHRAGDGSRSAQIRILHSQVRAVNLPIIATAHVL